MSLAPPSFIESASEHRNTQLFGKRISQHSMSDPKHFCVTLQGVSVTARPNPPFPAVAEFSKVY
jgi:hypothetical protein